MGDKLVGVGSRSSVEDNKGLEGSMELLLE